MGSQKFCWYISLSIWHIQIFLVSICCCAKRYIIWFPLLRYESLFIMADFMQVIYPKISKYISPGEVDKGTFTTHPHVPKVYCIYIYLKYSRQIQSWKWNQFYFIHSLGTLNLEYASWQNAGPVTNHKLLEDYYIA